jgi:hypothetical protein
MERVIEKYLQKDSENVLKEIELNISESIRVGIILPLTIR